METEISTSPARFPFLKKRGRKQSGRTFEQRRAQYELEKALATRLREASREKRKELYTTVYNEFFQQAPAFALPQLVEKEKEGVMLTQWRFLRRFLHAADIFLEIGAGDCKVSLAAAQVVEKVYALEVSEEITRNVKGPENFALLFFQGDVVPPLAEPVSVIYSNQLMEHLHPEDAREQLTSIYHALGSGGCYICVTPNRLSGPHDISGHFDPVATGFHLKEYTNTNLSQLFRQIGFAKVKVYAGAMGLYWRVPLLYLTVLERLLEKFPYRQRRALARLCLLYNIRLVGVKA